MTTTTEQLTAPYALNTAANLIEKRGLAQISYVKTINDELTSLQSDDAYIPCAVAAIAIACDYAKHLGYIIDKEMNIDARAPEHLRRNRAVFLKSLMLLHKHAGLKMILAHVSLTYNSAESEINFWNDNNNAETVISAMRKAVQTLANVEVK